MGVKTFVKEATTQKHPNDPSEGVLRALAKASYSFQDYIDLMSTLWSRINSQGRLYLHIQKALYILHYLLIHGSEQVINESRVHAPEIRTLTDFYDTQARPNNGEYVRERAHAVMKLLNNDEVLFAERAKFSRN